MPKAGANSSAYEPKKIDLSQSNEHGSTMESFESTALFEAVAVGDIDFIHGNIENFKKATVETIEPRNIRPHEDIQDLESYTYADKPVLDAPGDRQLNSPLHIAAKMGREDIAEVLVQNGCDLTAPNHEGKTPLEVANGNAVVSVIRSEAAKRTEVAMDYVVKVLGNNDSPENKEQDISNAIKYAKAHFEIAAGPEQKKLFNHYKMALKEAARSNGVKISKGLAERLADFGDSMYEKITGKKTERAKFNEEVIGAGGEKKDAKLIIEALKKKMATQVRPSPAPKALHNLAKGHEGGRS